LGCRLGMGVVVMGLLFLPRFGHAHTPGMSVAEFEVLADGHVDGRLAFASAEPLGKLVLDRRHDGQLDAADLAAARDDLRAFVLEGVEVSADESRCPADFRGASLAEPDGLVLEATYACPAGAAEIAVTLYYLSDLPRGHREVARIVAGSSTAEAVLAGDRRRLALKLPGAGSALRRRPTARIVALAVCLTVAVVALAFARILRRRRGTRAP